MSDSGYIDRVDKEGNKDEDGISIDEWVSAVSSIKGARIAGYLDEMGTGSKYDVEIEHDGDWLRFIFWHIDYASFPAGFMTEEIKRVLFELAHKLNAKVLSPDFTICSEDDFSV